MASENEEKLREHTLEVIKLQLKSNFFNLICDICEYNNDKPYKETEDILYIKDEIFDIAVTLQESLALDIDKRDEYIERTKKIKKDLIKAAKPLFLYDESMELIFEMLKTKNIQTYFSEKNKVPLIDKYELIAGCSNYVAQAQDEYTMLYRKSAIMSILPVKMTTENYNGYLKNSLKRTYSHLPYYTAKMVSEKLKEKYAPFLHKDFGTDKSITAEAIKALLDTDLSSKTSDELEELIFNIQDTQENNWDIISDYGMYYNDLNYLLNILSFCVDHDYIIDDDMQAKDLFYSLKNLNNIDDLEAFSEPMLEKAEQKFEEIFDILKVKEKELSKISKIFTKKSYSNFSQSTMVTLTTFDIIMLNHYDELSQNHEMENINIDKDTPLCTEEQVEEIINDFIGFVSSCRKQVSVPVYRELRRLFMKTIPCPLANADFMYTLQSAIKENEDNFRVCAIYTEITELLQDEGYIDIPEKIEENTEEERKSLNFSVKL